jgi:hypothetical protein
MLQNIKDAAGSLAVMITSLVLYGSVNQFRWNTVYVDLELTRAELQGVIAARGAPRLPAGLNFAGLVRADYDNPAGRAHAKAVHVFFKEMTWAKKRNLIREVRHKVGERRKQEAAVGSGAAAPPRGGGFTAVSAAERRLLVANHGAVEERCVICDGARPWVSSERHREGGRYRHCAAPNCAAVFRAARAQGLIMTYTEAFQLQDTPCPNPGCSVKGNFQAMASPGTAAARELELDPKLWGRCKACGHTVIVAGVGELAPGEQLCTRPGGACHGVIQDVRQKYAGDALNLVVENLAGARLE